MNEGSNTPSVPPSTADRMSFLDLLRMVLDRNRYSSLVEDLDDEWLMDELAALLRRADRRPTGEGTYTQADQVKGLLANMSSLQTELTLRVERVLEGQS